MSILSDKILSYSPEQYIPFNTAYSLSPTNLGSGGTGAWTLSNEAPVLNATGGPDNTGCWQLNIGGNSDTTATRFRVLSSTSATVNPEITDGSFSIGIWFRYTAPLTTTQALSSSMTLFNVAYKGLYTTITISGGTSSNLNRGKLQTSSTQTGAITYSPTRVDDGLWHYLAIRFNETLSGVFDSEIYIDGALWATITAKTFTPSTTYLIETGFLSQLSVTDNIGMMELSNLYITPYSTISSTEISQIYAAGSAPASTNVTITETPATASALHTEPTIAIVANDHVEITTSILVSADFPSNIVAGADKNVNNEITGTLDASIEMINNVDISTGTDVSFSSTEMTATAELLEGILPVQPLTASATSGNHTVYVTPNYYSLVRASNPYAYFYDGQGTSSVNGGYQSGTFARGIGVTTNSDAGVPLNLVGSGKSWQLAATSGADNYLDFTVASATNAFAQHIKNGECSIELFYKPTAYPAYNYGYWTIFETEGLEIRTRASSVYSQWLSGSRGALEIVYKQGTTELATYTSNYGLLTTNNTHHIVVTISSAVAGQIQITGWVDGTAVISVTRQKASWTVADTSVRFGSSGGYNNVAGMGDGWFDELALYSQKLSNSEIITHYSFVDSQSPNRNISVEAMYANADSGNHNFIVTSNTNIQDTVVTASALIASPAISVSRVINITTDILTASAQNTDVTVYWGRTVYATTITAYAEAVNAYRLNTTYSQYVQTNVNPYRYVTFDGNNSYADYGTDNDYAVVPTTVGGTIVNPDEGINGKSAKTAGTSYITDGVILKESEYNDSWGTGLNNYHSSFWIQKAPEDNSTGLRVVWNLNGYADNQHVILYQYQGKLHLNFNNGSGTHINQATVANYDLFDGERHFVGVAFDHTGANSYVNLFVDAVDVMTVNLGTYTGTTINGTTPVGANDEANNHPRLSVGCLITPFASTALPVAPTNTKIYVDEVIWAKSSLTQTLATNLFNTMPVKGLALVSANAITATSEFNQPSIITNSIIASDTFTVNAELANADIYAELNLVTTAGIMDASADFVAPAVFENRIVASDVMVANVAFNDPGVIITIPGGPMLATVSLQTRQLFFSLETNWGLKTFAVGKYQVSPWSKFIRAQDDSQRYPHAVYGTKEIR